LCFFVIFGGIFFVFVLSLIVSTSASDCLERLVAISRSGRYPGLCVQAVGSGLCGQRLRARDESAFEAAPPDRRVDRRPTAFTTMRCTN